MWRRTVSMLAIDPKCLEGVPDFGRGEIIDETLLLQRALSFGFGCLAYYSFSKVLEAIPEPESILFENSNKNI
jgi:hypothetical protein